MNVWKYAIYNLITFGFCVYLHGGCGFFLFKFLKSRIFNSSQRKMYDKSPDIVPTDSVGHRGNVSMVTLTPSYSYMFTFEQKFSPEHARVWMDNNWTNGFFFCGFYILIVFSMKYYMQNRPRFDLRKILVLWNTMLATFSIIGTARTLPELYHVISNYGIYHSVCVPR